MRCGDRRDSPGVADLLGHPSAQVPCLHPGAALPAALPVGEGCFLRRLQPGDHRPQPF